MEDEYSSNKKRFSSVLFLKMEREAYQPKYPNVSKAIQLLRQILENSRSEDGRTHLYNIQPSIIRHYLMQALNTKWYHPEYFTVDNLVLKILANLVLDLRFFHDVATAKTDIIRLINRNTCPIFVQLCQKVVENITKAESIKMAQTSKEKYLSAFTSKEEALLQMNRHKDFYNFSGSSIHFAEEFPQYIDMLRGALKVGAKKQVICKFPKNCFGCVIFSMVNASFRLKQKGIAVVFLSELTNGWITESFYECILAKMKALYRFIKRNQDLQDKYQLVCLRFTEYDRSIYEYLSWLGKIDDEGNLTKYPSINSSNDFLAAINQFKPKIEQENQFSAMKSKNANANISSSQYLDSS